MKLFHSILLTLAALSFAAGAAADSRRPYVFVQGHSGSTQTISVGRSLQVQLPAGPGAWSLDGDSRNVSLVQRTLVPSPGRIAGTAVVEVFDLAIEQEGPALVVITSFDPPAALPGLVGQGRFELTLEQVGLRAAQ